MEKSRISLMFVLTLLLAAIFLVSVVLLLWRWQDSDAVLYAVLGGAIGWSAGILIAPYPEEAQRFAKFSKTLSAFISGYLVSKIETVWGFIVSDQHRNLFFNPYVQRRAGIFLTCFFLVGTAVFKSRSYLKGDHRGAAI